MTPESVSVVFAIGIIGALVAVVVAALWSKQRPRLARHAPLIVAAVAIGATLGSLYYSEIADYEPCRFCWFQRIAMYPIAVIAPIGIATRDRHVLRYTLALSSIGVLISAYHIQLQLFPDQSSDSCSLTSPCTAKWVEAFGFITIPQMAGAAFATIIIASFVGLRGRRS